MADQSSILVNVQGISINFHAEAEIYAENEKDVLVELEPGAQEMRYCSSDKVLGHLFRAVNEQELITSLVNNPDEKSPEAQFSLLKF